MLRAAQNADSSVPPWCACLGRRKLLSQDLHSIVRKKDSSLKHLSWAVLVSGYLLHGAAGANSGTSHLLETVAHKGAHAAGRSGGRAGAVSGLCVARRGVLRPPVPAVPSAAAARTVGAVSHTAPQQSSLVYIAAPHTSSQVTGYIAFQPQRPEQKLGDCHHGISHRRQVEHFFACLCLWSFAATNVLACHVATVSQRSTKYRTPALKVTCSAPPCQQTGAAPAGAARDAGPPRADGPAGARRGLLRVLDRVDVCARGLGGRQRVAAAQRRGRALVHVLARAPLHACPGAAPQCYTCRVPRVGSHTGCGLGQCRGGASCDTRLRSVDQWLPTFGGAARGRPRGNAYCPRVTGRRALAARWVPSKESEAQRGKQPAEPQVLQSARAACPGSSMAMLRTRPACSHAAGGQGGALARSRSVPSMKPRRSAASYTGWPATPCSHVAPSSTRPHSPSCAPHGPHLAATRL